MCGSLRLSLESTTLMGISTRPAAGKIGEAGLVQIIFYHLSFIIYYLFSMKEVKYN